MSSRKKKTVMMFYRSLIKSKIDYGYKVHNSASYNELANLGSVSNEALRISSGCFEIYGNIQPTSYHRSTSAPDKKR